MENQVVEPEVNQENLRSEILSEKGNPVEGKKPWELRLEKDHPHLIKQDPEESKDQEVVKEEPKEVEEESKEEPISEEQPAKTDEQPAKEQPFKEAQPAEANKDTAKEEAYIAEYAKRTGLSVEDAKFEVESLKGIATKYGNDPIKLAKAYREVQSGYDKLKVQASSNVNPAVAQIAANPRSYVIGEVKKNADKLVSEFREQNPARSRDLDDEQILEELVDRGTAQIRNQIRDYEIRLKSTASEKREELIRTISDADRRFLPEIKPVLEQLPDFQIVSETFKMEDLINWAKGKSVDRLIKEAEERIHKQYESKNKNIVGEISKPSQIVKVKQTQEQSKSTGMSKWQKDQALQMFASSPMSDEEKFEAYLDVTKSKKK